MKNIELIVELADDISKVLEIADEGDGIVFEELEKAFLIEILEELVKSLEKEEK